jgi:general secretion pathway protein E
METLGAVIAAACGQLVLAVMHAADAATAAARLVDVGIAPFLVATSFMGALAQRLARRLCAHCRERGNTPPALLEEARRLASAGGLILPRDAEFYRAVGCERCRHTGYHGRLGLFELLEAGPVFRDAIARPAPLEELRALAVQQGMRTLAVDGLLKALDGQTTIEEVLRVL